MKKKDWYENWFCSAYYKILYSDRDECEAEQFVEKLLGQLEPPAGSRMLDIACGSGRYARQLAGHGYDVTGIDLSYQSIRMAKEHESDNLHFYVHDMRFPFYINYFQYAFNFFTSFGYFSKERDHLMAAKSFASALKKDGILVIDYLNTAYVKRHLVADEVIEKAGHRFDIKRRVAEGQVQKDILVTDAAGQQFQYAERVAAFSLPDFLRIFDKAGLKLEATYGGYTLGQYDAENSPRLLMIFKK